jgi:hypothetical protein
MVVGHYQPLADDGTRTFPHLPIASPVCTVRPNLPSAVDSEDKDKQAYLRPERRFSRPGDSLVFGLWENRSPRSFGNRARVMSRRGRSAFFSVT